ncbi:hypothetical protein [Geodermatophilus sp. SYSU D00710]
MRVIGVLCIVAGLVLLFGLRFVGKSERSAPVWTGYNKGQALFAGAVAIVAGVVLLVGGGQ